MSTKLFTYRPENSLFRTLYLSSDCLGDVLGNKKKALDGMERLSDRLLFFSNIQSFFVYKNLFFWLRFVLNLPLSGHKKVRMVSRDVIRLIILRDFYSSLPIGNNGYLAVQRNMGCGTLRYSLPVTVRSNTAVKSSCTIYHITTVKRIHGFY